MTIPQINYAALKQAMRDKGFKVSPGDVWRAIDGVIYREFHYLEGLPAKLKHYGMAYLHLMPEDFPGKQEGVEGVVAASAPIENQEGTQAPAVLDNGQAPAAQTATDVPEGGAVNTEPSAEEKQESNTETPAPQPESETPPADDVKEEVKDEVKDEEPKDEIKE